MSGTWLLSLSLLALAPPSSGSNPATSVDAPEPSSELAPDAYSAEQAAADVELVVSDRGKGYLDARARLEANPAIAAPAVIARLEAVPAPGPDQRDRLLFVLAALERPEHASLFGEQLRAALLAERPVELWLQLLRKQGAAATDVLVRLVGDRELGNGARGDLLELLIELAPRERLGELMTMVGYGASELQDRLRRAVIRRAKAEPEDERAFATGIDERLTSDDASEPNRAAQLVILRAACCSADASFAARLEQLASDAGAAFEVRVAAIDGLGRLGLGEDVLVELAREQVSAAHEGSQSGEVLASLALEALPEARAGELSTELRLVEAEAPRLATLGYRFATLSSDHAWLAGGLEHAWPEVRQAALGRVEGACSKGTVRTLMTVAGPLSRGGDDDARVGRSAVSALGRCGDEAALSSLRKLLEDTGVEASRRAEAARQLVLNDPKGPDYVAGLLISGRYAELSRDFASALGKTEEPSETVREALCRASEGNPMVASTAHDSFVAVFPGESCSDE